eukprot:1735842-Ditylum_brightwellii.AAC.1
MAPRSREKESITGEGAAPVHQNVESPDILPPIPEVDGIEEEDEVREAHNFIPYEGAEPSDILEESDTSHEDRMP